MKFLILILSITYVTCHNIERRYVDNDVDEEGYDWEAGPPRYEHFHYAENGEIDFAPRIIGGTPSWHGEFPAKISLQTRAGAHFCGGALIDLRHVLTAAHCIVTEFGAVFDPNAIRLMGDDLSIQRWGSGSRQLRFASHIFAHPSFDMRTYQNDIGVVRASVIFIQTTTLQAMPRSFTTPVDNVNCNLAGWGVTSETNTRPHPILLRVELQIIAMNFCNGTQSFHGSIPDGSLCAGSLDGSRDACFGDSGGGLMCNGQIAGVVSFGFGCGRRNFPGVYVDVSQYNGWIGSVLIFQGTQDDIPRPPIVPSSSSPSMFIFAKVITIALIIFTSLSH
ncbi:CLUMA_CG004118, isoform A [Clunio marinus]|uniref:CLUMA_CG004118, isoform A n=1 Tax=Clunio marinus TaxID=568069 RepID=A0A1J1HVI6_9DIPT|nr:CLUMA_CG004118, isoform A [Clunio marinus]